jgi:DNA processing protein
MHAELLYQISLTLIPNVGPVQAKNLLAQLGSARAVFTCPSDTLKKIEGIGDLRATAIKKFNDFRIAEQELRFIEEHQITPLFINEPDYPKRLLHCYDCPTLLYYKGAADLNNPKTVAVVGTRTNTEYGRITTDQLIEGLSSLGILVVSGLAHGIDAIAHRAALKNGLPTVGVLAHGLSQVYPAQHTSLAREIVKEGGGLLTEFRSPSIPDRHQFPARNRIVAGMTDATIVVETGVKGGSMITAELANGYNRDVFAFPGKISDPKSAGCNHLIRHNKAALISDTASLLEVMNWGTEIKTAIGRSRQREIFVELTKEEQVLVNLLRGRDAVHIDEINLRSGLPNSTVAAAILNMELQNVVMTHPGKRYSLY